MTHLHRVRPGLVRSALVLSSALLLAVLPSSARSLQAQDNQGDPFPNVDSSTFETREFPPPAAHASIVEGRAVLARDGDGITLEENEPLIEGDQVSTERGRAELLFPDASTLSLDESTTVEVLGPAFVRLLRGRVALTVDRRVAPNTYRVDSNGVIVWIRSAGEFRIATSGPGDGDVRVATLRGLAEVDTSRDRVSVRAGYETFASGGASALATYAVPVTTWTAFDRWVESNQQTYYSQSGSGYLPSELRAYSGVLAAHGSWAHEPSYGYVWYPRVDPGWQPYSVGRWSSVGAYGWTWIGVGRWSWPTHHYGRWGYSGARWYWIPGRRWSPAWVTWASAPGYVAWCPVGYVGGPRFSIGVSFNTWRGWSATPSRGFSVGAVVVHRDRVPFTRISERFVVRSHSPVRPALRSGFGPGTRAGILPGNTAQPRSGYGVGPAPRTPATETRSSRAPVTVPPRERESARQSGSVSPRVGAGSRVQGSSVQGSRGQESTIQGARGQGARGQESRAPEAAPGRPAERVVSPRFPSRSPGMTAPSFPSEAPRQPERVRPVAPSERPSPTVAPPSGTFARPRRQAAEPSEAPRSAPGPGRIDPGPRVTNEYQRTAPSRQPAAAPAPSRPQPSRAPANVERQAPRPRGGGSEGAGAGAGSGRAAPRAEPRGGSRSR